ncbi:MAG: glycerol-3-phosphate 1-O-acyltransferase [Gammaproteobacteria bacterium]|nr:glycerol-3-phosphate 1-O-acyltransferase [Gammaproteobacteria bacterium]
MAALLFIILAYLVGSLNFAIICCKIAGLPDPRQQGSGNPGATNVLRIGGKKLAAIVMLGDALKGLLPVLIARAFDVQGFELSIVAMAAVLGHMYPIFFRFQGGKGIATILGAIFGLSWIVGSLVVLTWALIATIFRYSSLASLCSIILLPIYLLLFSDASYIAPMIIIMMMIVYRHRNNIQRLINQTEPKIGRKK